MGAAVVAIIATLMLRRSLLRGRRPRREPNANEIACLAGGPARVVTAALAGLRAGGRIEMGESEMRATATKERAPGGLDGAILKSIRRGGIEQTGRLLRAEDVREEIVKISRGLVGDGLLLGRD